MKKFLGQEVYIQNLRYGYLFAADRDLNGKDHLLETRPMTSESDKTNDKFKWIIQELHNKHFIIRNKKYGYIFAADNDLKDNYHLLEARTNDTWTDVETKFSWDIAESKIDNIYHLINDSHGYIFASSPDIMNSDHLAESCPDITDVNINADKFKWIITPVYL